VARGRGYGGGATPARQRSTAPTRLACDEEWPACFVARSISGGDERRCASCPCESSAWWRTATWLRHEVRRIIKHNLKSNNNLETDAVYTTCINEFRATSLSMPSPSFLSCYCVCARYAGMEQVKLRFTIAVGQQCLLLRSINQGIWTASDHGCYSSKCSWC
jgi:hypothetical protein